MKPSESQWEDEEMQAKLQGKYGTEGQAETEEEQDYLDKKRPY